MKKQPDNNGEPGIELEVWTGTKLKKAIVMLRLKRGDGPGYWIELTPMMALMVSRKLVAGACVAEEKDECKDSRRLAMVNFDALTNEDWRILVDESEINEPTICYPDPDHPRAFVGPLVKVSMCVTVDDDEGNEVLDLEGADGRNLAAVACLPQFAQLFRWIKAAQNRLNSVHFDQQTECGQFMNELRNRIRWIAACIDDRDETMGVGMHGFERFQDADR